MQADRDLEPRKGGPKAVEQSSVDVESMSNSADVLMLHCFGTAAVTRAPLFPLTWPFFSHKKALLALSIQHFDLIAESRSSPQCSSMHPSFSLESSSKLPRGLVFGCSEERAATVLTCLAHKRYDIKKLAGWNARDEIGARHVFREG